MSEVNIEAFLNTHGQLLAAVDGLSEEQVKWKQAPEIWSVQEVVSHLVDHSIVISFRIRDIVAGTSARLPAFD
ncbi:DinB family protein [Paenibacillus fonticola]|uniref:DinB family protein n=1 Tax=Paenibacillus fonticola TaxID=379896 RepID=UPI000360EC7C